jgi:hypothetical protein
MITCAHPSPESIQPVCSVARATPRQRVVPRSEPQPRSEQIMVLRTSDVEVLAMREPLFDVVPPNGVLAAELQLIEIVLVIGGYAV